MFKAMRKATSMAVKDGNEFEISWLNHSELVMCITSRYNNLTNFGLLYRLGAINCLEPRGISGKFMLTKIVTSSTTKTTNILKNGGILPYQFQCICDFLYFLSLYNNYYCGTAPTIYLLMVYIFLIIGQLWPNFKQCTL